MKENDVELGTFSTVLTPNTIFEIIKCHSTAHGMKKEGAQTHCAANITFSAQARTHHTAAVHRIAPHLHRFVFITHSPHFWFLAIPIHPLTLSVNVDQRPG